jgi:four helix bundle protein
MDKINSYKDLIVWQRSIELVIALYELMEKYPKEEIYGLTNQSRRAAVSIPSNIAEGRYMSTKKDFSQFLRIAFGSGAEL